MNYELGIPEARNSCCSVWYRSDPTALDDWLTGADRMTCVRFGRVFKCLSLFLRLDVQCKLGNFMKMHLVVFFSCLIYLNVVVQLDVVKNCLLTIATW